MDPVTSCHGVLALELKPGAVPARLVLAQEAAENLAMGVARDLARFDGGAADLDLALLAAAYDPVELLRPGLTIQNQSSVSVGDPNNGGLSGTFLSVAESEFQARLSGRVNCLDDARFGEVHH